MPQFLTILNNELEILAKKAWFTREEQIENSEVMSTIILFKWLRTITDFETLIKLPFLDPFPFKNKKEKDELIKLHQEVKELLKPEEQIILAYLCRGKISLKFIEILHYLGTNFLTKMPNQYLQNCLLRITHFIEIKAHEYKEILNPFIKKLQNEISEQYKINQNKINQNEINLNSKQIVKIITTPKITFSYDLRQKNKMHSFKKRLKQNHKQFEELEKIEQTNQTEKINNKKKVFLQWK